MTAYVLSLVWRLLTTFIAPEYTRKEKNTDSLYLAK